MTESSNTPPKKKLSILDLIPPKIPVSTSIGEFYVRRARVSDWESIGGQTPEEWGGAAIRQLVNQTQAKDAREPLLEHEFQQLQEEDIRAIGTELAKLNGWDALPEGDALAALGICAERALAKVKEDHQKMLADMQESLKSSYSFLNSDTLAKLQSQMGSLADISSPFSEFNSAQEALAKMGPFNAEELLKGANAHFISRPVTDFAPDTDSWQDRLDVPGIFRKANPVDTPLGRATLESARVSKEVAQKMEALVSLVAGLNETVIRDILPAWAKQFKADQATAEEAFSQASTGLRWTQIAVVLSIVVTLGATWWQVQVARDIDRENSEQQKRVEYLMQQQLDAQRQLTEQYAKESESLRAVLAKLTPVAPLPPKR